MFKCFIYRRRITQLIDDELDGSRKQDLIEHIGRCKKCNEIHSSLVSLSNDVKMMFMEETEGIEPLKHRSFPVQTEQPEYEGGMIDKILEFVFTYNAGQASSVTMMGKLVPAILITLFILLFFASPINGLS